MATVIVRAAGALHHSSSSELHMAPLDSGHGPRHIDLMWPLWAILDRTPQGRDGDWEPKLHYP